MVGIYDKYRPRGITQPTWDSWMVDVFYDSSNYDPTIFNKWWYNRVQSEALGQLIKPDAPAPTRRLGRKARVGGIQPFGHPDYVSSVSDYGGLHFGTEFGWQRKVKDAPRGRETGFAGQFILMVSMGREWNEIRRTFSVGGKTYHKWGFKDMLAAGWALIDEAQKRGDYITIMHTPRAWEEDYDKFWQGDIAKRQLRDLMRIQWFERTGKPITIRSSSTGSHGGRVERGGKALLINPSLELWNYGISHDYQQQINNISQGRFSSSAEFTPPMFVNSLDYEGIKRFWLGMPNFGSGDYYHSTYVATDPMYFWFYLRKMSGTLSKTGKTNIIWLGTSQYPQLINTGWRYLEEIQSKINMWFFDIGDSDKEGEYFGDDAILHHATRMKGADETEQPLMVGRGGKRLFNYVYVDDISQLTKRVLEVTRKLGQV